jgi:hypothetical protein
MADKNLDPKDIRAFTEEYKKDQGDYNNLLKDSIKYLNQSLSAYEKIQGKIQGLNKDTLNLRTINKELEKSRQKQITETTRLQQLEKEIQKGGRTGVSNVNEYFKAQSKIADLQKRQKDAAILGDKTKLGYINQILAHEQKRVERMKDGLKVDEVAYITQKEAVKLAEKQTEYVQQQYESEKDIAKSVGFTGKLLGLTNKYLGVGGKLYGKIVEEAREGSTQTKTMVKLGAALGLTLVASAKLAKAAISKVFDGAMTGLKGLTPEGGGVVSGLTGGISSMAKNIPFIGGMLSGLIDGFSTLLDVVVGVDDAIVKAGRNLGMSSGQARQLNRHFQDISLSQGNVFVTSKKLLESYSELAGQLEINNKLSDATLQTNIMLKDFAGLELETRSKLAEVSTITGKSTQGVVKNVLAQVKGLERATGVQFNHQKILKEVTSLSGVLGLTFSKYPAQLTKSLLTIKAMGMDMKQLDSMADSFLDFESSVTKEMEAQILTGKDINLNKARELFLNNDLAGAAAEINKHVGSSADFLKMNRLQAQSLAEAMGMSRDQMADMLQKQEMYSRLGAKGTENAREMYQLALKKYGTEKEMAAAMGEQAYQSMVQASTQEKLMAFIEKIKQSVVDFVERSGIIEKVEKFVNMLTDPNTIRGIVKWVRDAIAGAIEMVSGLIGDIFEVVADLPFTDEDKWMERANFFKSGGMAMANRVRSVGGNFGATSVNTNMMYQNRAQAEAVAKDLNSASGGNQYIVIKTMLDGQEINQVIKKNDVQNATGKIDGNRIIGTSGR